LDNPFVVQRNEDFARPLICVASDTGLPLDLSAYTALVFTVRVASGATGAALVSASMTDVAGDTGITMTDPVNGKIFVLIRSLDLKDVSSATDVCNFVYDLMATDGGGIVTCFSRGQFTILPGVT
jgi:hypothetical protein